MHHSHLKWSSSAVQGELQRVHGTPQYKALQGKGSDKAQADEAWEYARSWSSSLVEDVFAGQLQSTLRCPACGKRSHSFSDFLDLSLPLPKKTGRAACTIEVKHDCSHACSESVPLQLEVARCIVCVCSGSDAEVGGMHSSWNQ